MLFRTFLKLGVRTSHAEIITISQEDVIVSKTDGYTDKKQQTSHVNPRMLIIIGCLIAILQQAAHSRVCLSRVS